jgi:hypothetical protein
VTRTRDLLVANQTLYQTELRPQGGGFLASLRCLTGPTSQRTVPPHSVYNAGGCSSVELTYLSYAAAEPGFRLLPWETSKKVNHKRFPTYIQA